MTPLLLSDVERAVRGSWSAETCTPEFRARRTGDNPARDQCGVTAMVLNDLLGGEPIRGEVHVGGERVDHHWWNRLSTGTEIDLTRERFGPEEVVTGGVVVPRPPATEWRRLREEYELLLRDRVLEKLDRQRASAGADTPPDARARHDVASRRSRQAPRTPHGSTRHNASSAPGHALSDGVA